MSRVDEQLFLILDYRLNHNLPTIYTTNLNKRELASRVDDRVLRRLDTGCMAFLQMQKNPRAVVKDSTLVNRLMQDR